MFAGNRNPNRISHSPNVKVKRISSPFGKLRQSADHSRLPLGHGSGIASGSQIAGLVGQLFVRRVFGEQLLGSFAGRKVGAVGNGKYIALPLPGPNLGLALVSDRFMPPVAEGRAGDYGALILESSQRRCQTFQSAESGVAQLTAILVGNGDFSHVALLGT